MRRLAMLGVTFALVVSGCSGSDDRTGPGAPADHNDADATYVEVAGLHLGWTAQIADLADERAASDEVEALASEIADEARAMIESMQGFEDEWDLPEVIYSLRNAFAPPQMRPDDDYFELEEAEGEEFDVLWVEAMVERVPSAMASAETLIDEGASAGLRRLAEDVIDLHEAWLEELEDLEAL